MTRIQAAARVDAYLQQARDLRLRAMRHLDGPRRQGLLAWARQYEAEADRVEGDWNLPVSLCGGRT